MTALLDTCVVIDFLQKREPFAKDALLLFKAMATEQFNGVITAKSATDIYSLMHHVTHNDTETRNLLTQLLSVVSLLDSKADDIYQALLSKISDFENAVMIETAKRNPVDCIITRNDRDFKEDSIAVYTPAVFLEQLNKAKDSHS